MALEFQKLSEQVMRLGAMVEKLDFDMVDRLRIARERYFAASDLDEAHRRILLMRQSDISGYRGAAPLDAPYSQPINAVYPAPEQLPTAATIIAVDGSQIYPNERAPVHYYVLNVGAYVYHHGYNHLPEQITFPKLFFHKDHVHDEHRQVIGNRTVDARRTVTEMKTLANLAWEMKSGIQHPIIALYDNKLLFWAGTDVIDSSGLMRDYFSALQHLYDVQANGVRATLAGYVDTPRGTALLRLLHLMSMKDEAEIKARQREIAEGGDLEGLRDIHLLNTVLQPGERTALMVQNSPRNYAYRKRSRSYEIAFFYVRVIGNLGYSTIARVDVPMWVARDPAAVNDLHAMILAQSSMQGRNPYPYALTRADELAYISSRDKAKLDEMISLELRRKGINPITNNFKLRGKELARSDRQYFELNTELK